MKYSIVSRKWIPYIIIGVLLLILIAVKLLTGNSVNNPANPSKKYPVSSVNRDRGFDRRVSFLEYSEHARCRMECRKISQAEVKQIMQEGKINYNKSEIKNAQCPRYALEGVTGDGQRVRIVFAQCNEKTVVVTTIDLETDYACSCPGDDEKYKNKR